MEGISAALEDMFESYRLQGTQSAFAVTSADEQVNVGRIPDSRSIHLSHPSGHGIGTNDGVGNTWVLESCYRALQALADSFDRPDYPLPGHIAIGDICHARSITPRSVDGIASNAPR